MERPHNRGWGQQPPPTSPQSAHQPYGTPQPYAAQPSSPYEASRPSWGQRSGRPGSPGDGSGGGTKHSLRSPVGRDRGARGALLGLGTLVAGIPLAIVLCLLPPHWTALRIIGFLLGMVGVFCFVAYANNGRSGRSLALGLLFGAAFLGAALLTFEDTVLAATGVEGDCEVVGSEKQDNDAGGYQYNYSVECPGGESTLRGQPKPPPDSVTVVYQPDGLIEPQAPEEVSPALSLVGAVLSGSGCVAWALAGLRGGRRGPQEPYGSDAYRSDTYGPPGGAPH